MKVGKIVCILLFLSILTIGTVSANDNLTGTNDDVLQDTSSQEIETSGGADVISWSGDNFVNVSDNGTFTALQQRIDEAEENSTITLENDYTYDTGFSSDGINISKSLTIDGNGYTINAKSQGRIFYMTANMVVLKNITFTNGVAINGGAIYNYNGVNCTVDSCTFNNCSAYFGGAIDNSGVNCTVVSGTFNNCSHDHGGAIRNYGANCTVDSCTFTCCSAYNGGAICNYGANCTVDSCTFTCCSADNDGGAICNSGVNCTVVSCTFNNCSGTGRGAIDNSGVNCTVVSCTFNNCSAGNGGAIYNNNNGANFNVDSCTFTCCSAGNGGAIFNSGVNCTVVFCTFNNCSADYDGGAIDNSGVNCTVDSCTFNNCSHYYGGAIYNYDGDNLIVVSCNFTDCSALNGGAIMNYGVNCTVVSCTFNNCSADNEGGAIYNSGVNCTVVSCTFNNCSGTGGAIMNYGVNCTVGSCNFTDCSASNGGSICNYGVNCTVDSCIFINCSATGGGAIYNTCAGLTVVSCTFNNCFALNGGAIYNYNGDDLTVDSCTFNKCSVTGNGGAINCYICSNCTISHCYFEKCSASSGYSIDNTAGASITNNTFYLTSSSEIENSVSNEDISDLYDKDNKFIVNEIPESDNATFTDLQNKIDEAEEGSTINLENDYTYDTGFSTDGISISKSLTIDGNNHVIDALFKSRIFTINVTNVTLKNISFKNGYSSSGYGGAVYWSASNGFVSNCSFLNGRSENNDAGAIAFTNSVNSSVSNCIFINNSAGMGSGAIYIGDNSINCSVSNCSFTNSSSRYDGGVIIIWANSHNCHISDCSFVNSYAGRDGGAIFWFVSTNAVISNCSFVNCSVPRNGGAINCYSGSYGTISNCRFVKCSASSGYSIHNAAGASITNNTFYLTSSSEIENSVSNEDISDLYDKDNKFIVNESLITEKEYFGDYENDTDANLTFDDLKNLIDGAGVGDILELNADYVNNGSEDLIIISKSITIDGKGHTLDAKSNLGVFNVITSDVTIKNIIFKNGNYNYGGAIYFEEGNNLVVSNCTFINCSGYKGGAINMAQNSTFIFDSSFVDCSAERGGAIYFWFDANGYISNCSFVNCSAEDGGGIYNLGPECTVLNCSFTGCSAKANDEDTGLGGAVANEGGNLRISSSSFNNNNARSGGAVYGATVFNCELNNNSDPEIANSDNYVEVISDEITSDDEGIIILEFPQDAIGTLEVFINGTSVFVVEIVDGIAKIDLSKYKGEYTSLFVYSGDEKYLGFSIESNLTVNVNTALISAKNTNVIYKAGQKYKVTVYKDVGVVASGVSVVVKVNGKKFKTIKTSSKGIASFKVTQVPGKYKIQVTSLGKTITKKLTVKHLLTLKSVKVKKSAKKLVLKATLGKVNGKYLKKKKVTFKFNGKKYTAKTNKKGVAKVTIKSSVLKKLKAGKKITYQATYLKDTVKKTVKVKK